METQNYFFKLKSKIILVAFLIFSVGIFAQTTYTVNTTADSGTGSLRQAIIDANTDGTASNIIFSVSGTFTLVSTLDPILQPVEIIGDGSQIIDGNGLSYGLALIASSSGSEISGLIIGNFSDTAIDIVNTGSHRILDNYIGIGMDGETAFANAVGLSLDNSNGNLIKNNVISGNSSIGLYVSGSGSTNNFIQGNKIGTNSAGTTAVSNNDNIILVDAPNNTIGGEFSGEGNLISGALDANGQGEGLSIYGALSTGNQIIGNHIGTNASGTASIRNGYAGVALFTGANANTFTNNLISGNYDPNFNGSSGNGILITGVGTDGNIFYGNKIGTDVSGTLSLPNRSGFDIQAGPNGTIIGGINSGEGNLISGNLNSGIEIGNPITNNPNSSNSNIILNNFIGTDESGINAVPNGRGITLSNSQNNEIGGTSESHRNIISGNDVYGINIIDNSTNNSLRANFIGLNINGNSLGNGVSSGAGIKIFQSHANLIGGSSTGERNIISSNNSYGIFIDDGSENNILGNFIGTDVSGSSALGNTSAGIYLSSSTNNFIGGSNSLDRNIISGNTNYGIRLVSSSSNEIKNNYIGTDLTGSSALTQLNGISVSGGSANVIGGAGDEGNLISGNEGNSGIRLTSGTSGNAIKGNLIGTDASGVITIPNNRGIVISGSSDNNIIGGIGTERNIVSGNTNHGMLILGSNNSVKGNYIGLNLNGNPLGNGQFGIQLDNTESVGNAIGGQSAGEENVISGNGSVGVLISNGASLNLIVGNLVGTNPSGNSTIANGGAGVFIDASSSNTIGGNSVNSRNIISGHSSNNGVQLVQANSNNILGNYIGTDITGTVKLSNATGIAIFGGSGNIIGNSNGGGNLISGNINYGVVLSSATSSNNLQGNLMGTNSSGDGILDNLTGIFISADSNNNIIGGIGTEKNIISGNRSDGLLIYGGNNSVKGNYIGLDFNGNNLGNGRYGIYLNGVGATGNTIGGSIEGEGNVISGNTSYGIYVVNEASSNILKGNRVGTDITGSSSIGNSKGIVFNGSANSNFVGGVSGNEGNLISGNNEDGILIVNSSNNELKGNFLGVDVAGSSPLPNGQSGIEISWGSFENIIGGLNAGETNIIANNLQGGIVFAAALPFSYSNKISGNSIFSNINFGIDFLNDGVTNNDSSDPDDGPNKLQNFPVIVDDATFDGTEITLTYSVHSDPVYSTYPLQIEFFIDDGNRQGKEYLGSDTYTSLEYTNGPNKTISFPLPAGSSFVVGDKVLATATDAAGAPAGNTSEFGASVTVVEELPDYTLTVNTTGNGSVTLDPDQLAYTSGTEVGLTAVAASGWVFDRWEGDLTSSTNPETILMDGNKTVTAIFVQPEYTLTVNTTGNGSVTLDPDQLAYTSGTEVGLTAVAASGWVFDRWEGDLTSSTNPETILMDGNKTVTAIFVQPDYTLTVNTTGNGSVTLDPDQLAYTSGTEVGLTAVAASGWVFDRWEGDLTSSTNPEIILMDGHKTVTAIFVQPEYTLTVNTTGNGSVTLDPDQLAYTSGTEVGLTAVAASGWVFDRWEGDLTSSTNPETILMDGNKTVTAIFVQPEYTLTVNTTGNGSVTLDPDQLAYASGTEVGLTAVAASGWVFDRWEGDLTSSTNPETILMDGNKTVTAIFVQPDYTLTVNTTGNGSVTLDPDQLAYTSGTEVGLTAVAASGWVFDRWEGDLTSSTNPETILMDGNKTVTAIFVQPDYTLTVNATGNGSVTLDPDQLAYTSGTEVGLTAVAASGWVFDRWEGDLTSSTNPETILMDGNKTVTAIFVQPDYTLTVNTTGNGSVTIDPDQLAYTSGTEVGLTAVAASGWVFDRWEGDLTSSTNPEIILMDGHKTVTAIFVQPEYTLTVNTTGNGSVTLDPDQLAYTSGTEVGLTAVAASGWVFDRWEGDLTSSTNPETILMDGNKTVTAIFVQPEYTLTVNTTGNGSVTLDPDQLAYTSGTEVGLTAVAASGWVFDRWEGDLTSSTNPETILMDGNKTVTAIFVQPDYTLTVNTTGNGSVTLDPDQLAYTSGTEVGLTAVAASGWVFDRWEGDLTSSTNPETILMDGNKTVTAIFVQPDYTLTVNTTGNGSVTLDPDQLAYTSGTEVGLTAVAASGWVFDRWEGDLTSSTNPETILMDGNKTVTAIFVQPDYTLTVNTTGNGSVTLDPDQLAYTSGTEVGLTAVAASGWVFDRWEGDLTSSTNPETILMDGNKTVTAIFVQPEYTLTVNTTGNGSVTLDPDQLAYTSGTEVGLTAVAASGWVFDRWEGNLTGSTNPETILMDGNKTVTAIFVQPDYTLTVNTTGNGSVTLDPDQLAYTSGTEVGLTAVAASGWVFDRWEGDLTSSTNPETILMDGNKTVTAIFVQLDNETYYGCTPGFWKNTEIWCGDYSKEVNLFEVFGIDDYSRKLNKYRKLSLQDALDDNGGGFSKLVRHGTAALLNACSNGVNYPYSVSQIRSEVQAAFASGEKDRATELGNKYEIANEAGCPLDNSNSDGFDSYQETTIKLAESSTLVASPNPMKPEGLWLNFSPREYDETFSVSIYDLYGRQLTETSIEVSSFGGEYFWPLDHSGWEQGIYLLRAKSSTQEFQIKLVK